jgi:hypothetical protein
MSTRKQSVASAAHVAAALAAVLMTAVAVAGPALADIIRTSDDPAITAAIPSPAPAAEASIVDVHESKVAAPRVTVSGTASHSSAPASASSPKAPATTARVELKCWQHGVLIVNESRLVAAAEPFPYIVKFPAAAAGGLPTYLAESRNATCVIKPVGEGNDGAPRRR